MTDASSNVHESQVLAPESKTKEFLSFFDLAGDVTDILHETVKEVIPLETTGREEFALHQWTVYLGTLVDEYACAARELLLLDVTRAASVLIRQIYELWIKLVYYYKNEAKALALFDSLNWLVAGEANRAGNYFSADDRASYEENYRTWAEEHPELDINSSETNVKEMVKEVIGEDYETHYFRYYSLPSILGHGKPHGIMDVLSSEDGVRKHYWHSRVLDPVSHLSRVIAFTLSTAAAIRLKYRLDTTKVKELDGRHAALAKASGL